MPRHPHDEDPEPVGGRAMERLQDTLDRRYPGGEPPGEEDQAEAEEVGEHADSTDDPTAEPTSRSTDLIPVDAEPSVDDEPGMDEWPADRIGEG